jgi:fructose-1,6-bisphosphatase I
MSGTIELDDYLDRWTQGLADRIAIAETVRAVVSACVDIQALVARGPLEGAMSTPTGRTSGVDPQKKIDVDANDLIVAALAKAPVAALLSEELEQPLQFTPDAPLAVAVDPIDGSSNTDVNVSIGSIFSILPVVAGNAAASFLQPGQKQVAAGFTVYGPFTALVLTLGNGTQIFTLDPASTRSIARTTATGTSRTASTSMT